MIISKLWHSYHKEDEMERIKDLFYSIFKRILLLAILLGLTYVVYTNLDYLMDIRATSKDVAKISHDNKKENIEITIPEGINSNQLAKLLKGYKLIEDEDSFVQKFEEINKDNPIPEGDFNIEKGSEIEEIIDIITK